MALSNAIDDRPMFGAGHWPRLRAPLSMIAAGLVLAIAWLIAANVADPRFMPVTTVRVEGEFKHLTRASLHAAIADYAVGSFFGVDVDAVRRAALRSPWVASVSVRRVWPDTLMVNVVEHKPVAQWGDAGLLSAAGMLFTPPLDSFPRGLPLLSGPAGKEAVVLARLAGLDAALRPLHQSVQRLVMDERRAWSANLDNGIQLLLGREDIDARMRRYVESYALALAPRAVSAAAVDLRYTNGFAVRWQSVDAKEARHGKKD